MRSEDYVWKSANRSIERQRLLLENLEGGAAQSLACQRFLQCHRIDARPPDRVHDDRRGAHQTQVVRVDHMTRGWCERCMQSYDIGRLKELLEIHAPNAERCKRSSIDVWIGHDTLEPERSKARLHFPS